MFNLSLILTPLLALQSAGGTPVALENETPETWTLEYPRIVSPYVEDYRRCLKLRLRRVTGEANFEDQHRSDVDACSEEQAQAEQAATKMLAERGDYAEYTSADVHDIFEHIGRIHIARGADLDNQFTFVQQRSQLAQERYEEERPKGLILELHDASVVKARTDATAEAAEEAHRERMRELHGQEKEAQGAPN